MTLPAMVANTSFPPMGGNPAKPERGTEKAGAAVLSGARPRPRPRLRRCFPLGGKRAALLALIMGVALPACIHAEELEPNEFVTAAPGTTALIGYFVYGDHDSYHAVGSPGISNGTHLDDTLGIARAAEYFDIGKTEFLVEFLQPFGADSNARIGGTHYQGSSGAGDTQLALAVWPINDKAAQRYVGLTLYMTLPDGAYDRTKTINLGGNRLVYDPEVAFHQGLGKKWSMDLSGDLIVYGHNTAAGPLAFDTLTERPTVQIQAFLNYTLTKRIQTSVGYESEYGGQASLNSVATGEKTQFQEVRGVAAYSITPAWQILAEVNHQFSNLGGFKQDVGMTLRTLYAF